MFVKRCENKAPHYSHTWQIEVEHNCSGKASCGETIHAPHSFKKVETAACGGICNCIFIRKVHGLGSHK